MKTKTFFTLTFLLVLIIQLKAQEPLPDTVWTKKIANIKAVNFSLDSEYLFAGGRKEFYQLEITTGEIFKTFLVNTGYVNKIGFSISGDTIITSGTDATIRLWDYLTGDSIFTFYTIKEFGIISYGGSDALITPDGKRIITLTGFIGLDEPQILVIDIATKEIIKTFVGRYYYASNPQISSDGKYFSFQDFRGTYSTVILINLNTYEEIKIFENPNGSLNQNIFSPDCNHLTANSAGVGKDIFIWDLKTLKLFKQFQYEEKDVIEPILYNEKYTNDSKYLIMSFHDHQDYQPDKIIVWNIDGDSLEYEYPFSGQTAIDVSKDDYIAAYSQNSGYLTLLRPKWNGTDVKDIKEDDFNYTLKDGILKIKFKEEFTEIPLVNIYDISGKLIKSISDFEIQSDYKELTLNIGFLIPGVYLFEIKFSDKNYSFKLLKN
ncbi:MAG: T9SS type A sorting domain-containing protein [bacterium]